MITNSEEIQLNMFCTLERLGLCTVMIIGNYCAGEIDMFDVYEWIPSWEA